jgi:hypothetical protein
MSINYICLIKFKKAIVKYTTAIIQIKQKSIVLIKLIDPSFE